MWAVDKKMMRGFNCPEPHIGNCTRVGCRFAGECKEWLRSRAGGRGVKLYDGGVRRRRMRISVIGYSEA